MFQNMSMSDQVAYLQEVLRQKEYECRDNNQRLRQVTRQSVKAKTKLNKIQKNLKNVQRDNQDLELMLAKVLASKLVSVNNDATQSLI